MKKQIQTHGLIPQKAILGVVPFLRVLVDKPLADRLLEHNKSNREISARMVEGLRQEQIGGRWRCTPDAVVIGRDLCVYNGQHRLDMVSKHGTPAEMLVYLDAPCDPETLKAMDAGRPRNLVDFLRIFFGTGRQAARTLRAMWAYSRPYVDKRTPILNSFGVHLHEQFGEHAAFAAKQTNGKGPGHAATMVVPVLAVVARAHAHHAPEADLRSFLQILATNLPIKRTRREDTVFAFRAAMDKRHEEATTSGSALGRWITERAECALAAYLTNEGLKKITPAADNPWPLVFKA